MKETIETDAIVVSKATALPKRKASEPFFDSLGQRRYYLINQNYELWKR